MWLLDEGVLLDLARHSTHTKLSGAPLCITEMMEANVRECQHRSALLAAGVISVRSVAFGSAAAAHFRHLRRLARKPDADIGEHEAIALLHAQSSGVFVTRDKRAAMLALHELGPERVMSPYDLWLKLEEGGWIDRDQAAALCEATRKAEQSTALPWRLPQWLKIP